MTGTRINALGGFSQLGMIVRDVDAAMAFMTGTLGIGPFIVAREVTPEDFRYRGTPSRAPVMTMAFAQAGPLQIELIQQHDDAPSAYTEFLAAGREGAQHLSIWFDDRASYADARARLIADGHGLVHEAGEAASQRFAYFETALPGGMMVELAEARTPAARGFMEMVARQAEGWRGEDPIRPI